MANERGPWLGSIRIENFKALKALEIKPLKLVNVIGGSNGSGKSTLLEAIGVLSLQDNPPALLNILKRDAAPLPLGENGRFLFHWQTSSNSDRLLSISADTMVGRIEARLELVEADDSISGDWLSELSADQPTGPILKPGGILRSSFLIDGEPYRTIDYPSLRFPALNNVQANVNIPPVSPRIRQEMARELPGEYAGKLNYYPRDLLNLRKLPPIISGLVRSDRLEEYISALNLLIPGISQINLADQAEIYVKQNGRTLPLSYCGGGAQLLAVLAATIMTGANGLFLFEHFESEVHCTLLPQVWGALGKLAKKYNCQLFISTHSKESLLSAYNGLSEAGLLDEMLYIRLDKTDGGGNRAVAYTPEELGGSLAMNIDVR